MSTEITSYDRMSVYVHHIIIEGVQGSLGEHVLQPYPKLLPRRTGRDPGISDQVHHHVLCVILCLVLIVGDITRYPGNI